MNNNLSMNWYKFTLYFKFPIIILTFILGFISSFNELELFNIFYNIFFIAFIVLTYALLLNKSKKGYYLNIIYLILETLIFSILFSSIYIQLLNPYADSEMKLISLILFIFFLGFIWLLPNYLYFKNRKYIFNNVIVSNDNNVIISK